MTHSQAAAQELSLAEQYTITSSVETLLELWLVDNACNDSLEPESPRHSGAEPDSVALGDWLISALVRSGEASLRLKDVLSKHPDLITARVESLAERQEKVTAEDLGRLKTALQERGQNPATWAEEQLAGLVRTLPREIQSVGDRNRRLAEREAVQGDIGHDSLCFLGGVAFALAAAGGPIAEIIVGYEIYSECF